MNDIQIITIGTLTTINVELLNKLIQEVKDTRAEIEQLKARLEKAEADTKRLDHLIDLRAAARELGMLKENS